jgi:hypothetical protein
MGGPVCEVLAVACVCVLAAGPVQGVEVLGVGVGQGMQVFCVVVICA